MWAGLLALANAVLRNPEGGVQGPAGAPGAILGAVEAAVGEFEFEFPGASASSNVAEVLTVLTGAPKFVLLTIKAEGFIAVGIVSLFFEGGVGRFKCRAKTVEGNEPGAGTKFKAYYLAIR